jgi:hypothetical protein
MCKEKKMSAKTTYYCDLCGKEFEVHTLRGSVDFIMPDGKRVNVKLIVKPKEDKRKTNQHLEHIDVCPECRKPFINEYAKQFGGVE